MALTPGARLGTYEILGALGAGGMGEVYRARDTKLGRDVAIKVLSTSFATDPDRLARFEREARLLATLNHPNIGAIYGVEESGGVTALVLELVEGETLAQRLASSPAQAGHYRSGSGDATSVVSGFSRTGAGLPLADALAIARQIADALDAAHERGIVHRDLKPANIVITADGVVKVLDFGLARSASLSGERDADSLTHSPTVIGPTVQGVLLGTAPYMSPEQARGKVVDKRTDIWAFGCVLCEMLTGRRAFTGETTTDVLAKIVEREPDWTKLPAATPNHIVRLIKRCLEKDPKKRLRDIGDARTELSDATADDFSTPVRSPVIHSRRREYVAWSMAGLLAASLGVALLWLPRANQAPAAPSIVRTTVALPGDQTLATGSTAHPLAVSSDGTRIAYVGEHEGVTQLYVRELSALEAKVMPGTTGATHPFFSPDSQWVAFFADGALQKVAVAGGAPIRICKTPALSLGGSWGPDNTIVFALRSAGLLRVNAAGGEPVTLPDSAPAAWPEILPDGHTVLFTTGSAGSTISTIPLQGGPRHIVARTNDSAGDGPALLGTGDLAQVRFVPGGYLVYGQSPGIVRAVAFDPVSRTLTGSVVSMVSAIERGRNGGGVYFAVSNTGLLVYALTGERHQLVWVDRRGVETPISTDRLAFRHPRLSPDGARIAVAINDETRRSDIWVYDAERGTKHRLTTERHNLRPVWTPDGARITFAGPGFQEIAADGSGSRTTLAALATVARYPSAWSPDGRNLLFHANDPTGNRLSVLPRGGEPHALPTGSATSQHGQFSPDGRWIAYSSDESGRPEIYVAQFPDLGGKVAISIGGGEEPRWSRDGRELFFRQGDAVMAVSIDASHGVRAGKAQRLFAGHYSGTGRETGFDVSSDGRRFVMVKSDEASTLGQLTLVQNWLAELRARVPSGR